MLKISLTSRMADALGRLIIGSPPAILRSPEERAAYAERGLDVPDSPNFYLMEGDRVMPSAEAHTFALKRRMIFEDIMRRSVSFYSGLYCVGFSALIMGMLVMGIMGSNKLGKWVLPVVALVLLGGLGLLAYRAFQTKSWPGLAGIMPLDRMRREAMAETNAVSRRPDVPHGRDTTPDLDDVEGRFDLTPEGYRVSGRLLVDDMLHGSYSPVIPVWLAIMPVVLLLSALLGFVSPWLSGLVLLAYAVATIRLVGFWFLVGFFIFASLAAGAVALLGSMLGPIMGQMKGAMAAMGAVPTPSPGGGGGMGLMAFLGLMIPALAPLMFVGIKAYTRARALNAQGKEANAASQGKLSRVHIAARQKQAALALKDKSPFIMYGEAQGVATAKRDGFAPDAKKPMGQTINDLGLHLMILGRSGSGKTSTLLARALYALLTYTGERIGALVLDNKGSLPHEVAGIRPDYKVLSPEDSDVGLLEGLTGEERASAFLAVVAEEAKGDNAYWINNGSTFSRHAFVFHKGLVEWDKQNFEESLLAFNAYSPEELELIPEDERPATPVRTWADNFYCVMDLIDQSVAPPAEGQTVNFIATLAEDMLARYAPSQLQGLLRDACFFFARTLPGMDEKTRSNVKSQVDSWFSPLKSSSKLYRWVLCESGEDVSAVTRGAAYGLNTPEHRYQRAGLIASNMVKERVYSIIRNRPDMKFWQPGDGWTRTALCIDECQETISKSEDRMFAVARSKGMFGLFAAQSVDALFNKMGEKSALAFLGNISSWAMFKSTELTLKWGQTRLGMTENVVYTAPAKGLDYNYSARLALTSPQYDPTHPNARLMKGFVRGGGFGFKSLFKKSGLFADNDKNAVVSNVERKVEPLFDLAEIDSYLQTPFMCLMELNRGGVRRRDLVQCAIINLKDGSDIDPFALEEEQRKVEVPSHLVKTEEEAADTQA